MKALESFAELGWIPRPLVRIGIRRLIADRLGSVRRLDPVQGNAEFLDAMRTAPIAIHARSANEQHYEVPPDFFRLVLGPRRKYSACFWPESVATLADAEEAMLRLTCERAGIIDGLRVLDLGCGWGSLTRWILERYPRCRVTAVSNSGPQRESILADLARRGLADRVSVVTADMNVFDTSERFDRICSIEMFEHMRNWEGLLGRVAGWLTPEGRLLVHVFCHRSHAYPYEIDGEGDWMARNFFTGGMMPSFDLLSAVPSPFVVEERWKVPGQHYARTCEAWLANLDARRDEVSRLLGATYGAGEATRWRHRWELFFLACAELFSYGGGEEWFVGQYRLRRR